MKKLNTGHVILILLAIVVLAIILLSQCNPKPPPPKPTPTYTPTATLVPTEVEPTVTKTELPNPTKTPTPTLESTEIVTPEPTEFTLVVHTGYEDGWLHFRPGPSKKYLPNWVSGIGAFKENTVLKFVDCPVVAYSWVHIAYKAYSGYVYGEYLNKNPCSK